MNMELNGKNKFKFLNLILSEKNSLELELIYI